MWWLRKRLCGLWSVVCGMWSVVCGLWSVVCGAPTSSSVPVPYCLVSVGAKLLRGDLSDVGITGVESDVTAT